MIGRTIQKYEILEVLGAGGMGEVYRARDISLGRQVALKILPPELAKNADRLTRFKEEARAVAALDHPNIVTIYSVDEADGLNFLTMELVEGTTLDRVIPPVGMTLAHFFEVAIPIGEAVAAAHDRGIIHRDLKPSNIMVAESGTVKVLDFGLAKPVTELAKDSDSQLSTESLGNSRMAGTVPYMSPEQLQGGHVDQRADIFSLGVIFFEMLTGRRPFRGGSSAEVVSAILRDSPPTVERRRSDVPHHLSRITRRCLRKDPRRRWQTARDLHNELLELREEIQSDIERAKAHEPKDKRPSIAVLPFLDMSPQKDQGHLADGLADSLIAGLAQIKGLRVPARTSCFAFEGQRLHIGEIGRQLNVATVLEGSVQRSGDRLRVTASLIDVDEGYTIWSKSYDRPVGEIFRIEDEIAQSILGELRISPPTSELKRLSLPAQRQAEPQVVDLEFRATAGFHRRPAGIPEAMQCAQQALELDPRSALSLQILGACHLILIWYTYAEPTTTQRAMRFVEAALEIDDSLAESWGVKGALNTLCTWDFRSAAEDFERGIRLQPELSDLRWWHSEHLAVTGRPDLAAAEARIAMSLDPFSPVMHANGAWQLWKCGDRREGRAGFERTIATWGHPLAHLYLSWDQVERGLVAESLDSLESARRGFEEGGKVMPSLYLQFAYVHAAAGERDEALATIDSVREHYLSPFQLMVVYTALGDFDDAERLGRQGLEIKDPWMTQLRLDPRLQPFELQRPEAFAEMVEEVGLP